MPAHRVYFDKGDQTLYFALHRDGAPMRVSGATYAIHDTRFDVSSDDYTIVPPGTAATLDTVSTVLTTKAGKGTEDKKIVTVSSTAGITPFRKYILTSPQGRVEEIRVAAVTSATQLLASKGIQEEFPLGSTFKGFELSATFPSTAADDSDKLDGFSWVIVWTIAGHAPYREPIHLERGEEAQLATLDDLKELDPHVSNLGVDVAQALSRAHKTFRVDILAHGANESDMLTGPIGVDAVVNLAAHYCYRNLGDEGGIEQKLADQYLERYKTLLSHIVVGATKPQVVNLNKVDGTAEKRNPATLFRPYGF